MTDEARTGGSARPDAAALLAAFPEGVLALDARGTVLFANAAAVRLLAAGPLEGRALGSLLQPEARAVLTRALESAATGPGVPIPLGTSLETTLSPAPSGTGAAFLLVVRRGAEPGTDHTLTKYLQAATRLAARLTLRLDEPWVLSSTVDAIVADFDASFARLWIYDREAKTLAPGASAGSKRAPDDAAVLQVPIADAPAARAAQLSSPVLFSNEGGAHGTAVAIPVLFGGELEGVLECAFAAPVPADVVELLSSVSNLVATTLNDVRLIAQEREAREATLAAQVALELERAAAIEAQERLFTTLNSIGDAVIATDREARVQFMNPVAENLTGWTLVEARGRRLEDVFPVVNEETRIPIENAVSRVLREGVVVGLANHTILKPRRGDERIITSTAAPIRSERELLGTVLVFRDATHERTEQDWRDYLANASDVLSSSLDVKQTLATVTTLAVPRLADWCAVDLLEGERTLRRVAVMHPDPRKVELARELYERWPSDPDSPTDATWRVIRTAQPLFMPEITDAALQEALKEFPDRLETMRSLGLRSAITVPFIARGRVLGVMSFIRAESTRLYTPADLARAQELARRAAMAVDNAALYESAQQAVQARDEFLSIASHELRTPLTSLHLQMQSMLRAADAGDVKLEDKYLKKLVSAERQVLRISKLINELLDITRLSRGKLELELEPVDLTRLAREVLARFAEQLQRSGSTAELEVQERVLGRWDRLRIEQVVTNLVANAVKYGAGKPIAVRVRGDDQSAVFEIRDQGIGIADADKQRIFSRFERAVSSRHYGGLGLGLYITRQIVDAHHGRIEVTSEPGSGATFRVTLPLDAGRAENSQP